MVKNSSSHAARGPITLERGIKSIFISDFINKKKKNQCGCNLLSSLIGQAGYDYKIQ